MSVDCAICGPPCEGTTGAVIDDEFKPMCHEGLDPTCYQKWMWGRYWGPVTPLGYLIPQQHDQPDA